MIKKEILSLGVNFKHSPKEKTKPSSGGVIYFNKDEKEVVSMPIVNRGHHAFNNGFGNKRG
jgi:hypothetical protein